MTQEKGDREGRITDIPRPGKTNRDDNEPVLREDKEPPHYRVITEGRGVEKE